MPRTVSGRLGALAMFAGVFMGGSTSSHAFSLFCTYDLAYRLSVTIEVDGKAYTSEATRRNARSRDWNLSMNAGGCRPAQGTALAYRLPDGRAILIGSRVCEKAERGFLGTPPRDYARAMAERRTIDVAQLCDGRLLTWNRPDGFVLDNAERPTTWEAFRFGQPLRNAMRVRLISAKAQAMDAEPADSLAKASPGVFDTKFDYHVLWDSPEGVLPRQGRSKATRKAIQQ